MCPLRFFLGFIRSGWCGLVAGGGGEGVWWQLWGAEDEGRAGGMVTLGLVGEFFGLKGRLVALLTEW